MNKNSDIKSKILLSLFLKYKILKENEDLKKIVVFEDIITNFVNKKVIKEDDLNENYKTKITKDDLFTLTYDFFKTLDKKTFEIFEKIFKYHNKNVIFRSGTIEKYFCGATYQFYDNMDFYIKMRRYKDIRDVSTLIHEYGHAISFYLNGYNENFDNKPTPFSEIESIFLEILSFDYLDSIHINDKDSFNNRKSFLVDLYCNAVNIDNKFVLYNSTNPEEKINQKYYSKIKKKYDINKLELRFMYSKPVAIDIIYVISSLYAMELYDIYANNKEKALELYKKIITMNYSTYEDFINELSCLYIYPNETDTFIRTLKKGVK